MAIDYLVKINETELPKLRKYSATKPKLWKDAGRNLAGDLKTTFVGKFPKLLLEFGYLTATEVATVITLLDQPSFNVAWWDFATQTYKAGLFYAGDFSPELFDKDKELYAPFNVNLIAFRKLT